jgi:hypothetical protein
VGASAGRFPGFYQIRWPTEEDAGDTENDGPGKVLVVAIGHKEHNQLDIRGSKVEL